MRLLTAVSLVRVQQGEPPKKPLLSTKAKGVFPCFLEEKQAKSGKTSVKQAPERKNSRPEARFFVFRGFPSPKTRCTFCVSLFYKEIKKVSVLLDSNLKNSCVYWLSGNCLFSRSSTIRPRGLEHVETERHKSFGVLFAY